MMLGWIFLVVDFAVVVTAFHIPHSSQQHHLPFFSPSRLTWSKQQQYQEKLVISSNRIIMIAHHHHIDDGPLFVRRRGNDCRKSFSSSSSSTTATSLYSSLKNDQDDNDNTKSLISKLITNNPTRAINFSLLMILCGTLLGPFLDSFHSAFDVLEYDQPITFKLWGIDNQHPALITSWWVPELFGLAGFIIGWLYIILDTVLNKEQQQQQQSSSPRFPSPPKILIGISFFTFQYWLSGVLVATNVFDRTQILNIMSLYAAICFIILDGTFAGFITSTATAIGGPFIEIGLLSLSRSNLMPGGYHYNDLGETGFFPLWILPVYFLGGPAVGNLARGFWNLLSPVEEQEATATTTTTTTKPPPGCQVCNDTRRVPCPNCDGIGRYTAMGGKSVQCTSCRGRGFVICRNCFGYYDDLDPNDIEAIRDFISKMPD